jgi:HPt (histidine-containing phosphotransfer) domain-containing protein
MSIFTTNMDLINPETLETFQDLLDVHEFKDFFLRAQKELERSIHQIHALFEANEWAGLKGSAHRLKGSLGSVGCDALFLKLDQLEEQLRAEPMQIPNLVQIQELIKVAQETHLRLGQLSN